MSLKDFSHGNIQETIYFDSKYSDILGEIDETDGLSRIFDFCIDKHGNVRMACGLVSYDEQSYDDPNYVPNAAYDIEYSVLNYFIIELPNPFAEMDYSKKIRTAFLTEINSRFEREKKNAKARLARKK